MRLAYSDRHAVDDELGDGPHGHLYSLSKAGHAAAAPPTSHTRLIHRVVVEYRNPERRGRDPSGRRPHPNGRGLVCGG